MFLCQYKTDLMNAREYDLKICHSIKALRELRGIKQKTMADGLGMTQSNYCRIENGEIATTPGQLKIIAGQLEVSLSLVLAIAETDIQLNFNTTPLSEIITNFVMMLKGDEQSELGPEELEFIIRKIKSGYVKTGGTKKQ